MGFRNMGKGTMTELDNICKEHGIQIHSLSPIKQSFIEYHFSNELLEMFMRHNIFCVDDFKQKSAKDLYDVCGENYTLTMQTYYTLKRELYWMIGRINIYLKLLPRTRLTVYGGTIKFLQFHNYSIATRNSLKE